MYIYTVYTWKCVNVNDPSHQLLLILLNSPNVQTHRIIPKWYRNRSENSSLRPEPISCAPAKRGPWQFPAWQRQEFLAFPSKLPEPFGCVSLQEWSGAILGSLLGSHCKCRTSAWCPSSETMKDFNGYLIWWKLTLRWRLNWEFPYLSAMFKAAPYRQFKHNDITRLGSISLWKSMKRTKNNNHLFKTTSHKPISNPQASRMCRFDFVLPPQHLGGSTNRRWVAMEDSG